MPAQPLHLAYASGAQALVDQLLKTSNNYLARQALVRACAGCTLAAMLPAAVAEARRPSAQGLLRCMAASSFAFFLFAYQVHTLRSHCQT